MCAAAATAPRANRQVIVTTTTTATATTTAFVAPADADLGAPEERLALLARRDSQRPGWREEAVRNFGRVASKYQRWVRTLSFCGSCLALQKGRQQIGQIAIGDLVLPEKKYAGAVSGTRWQSHDLRPGASARSRSV